MDAKAKKRKPDYALAVVTIGIPIATFIGGAMFNAWGIADKLATKPYVDERFDASKKYTDERIELVRKDIEIVRKEGEQIRKDAFEHADTNKQMLTLELQKINSESRESLAKVTTTLELLVRSVQTIRDDAYKPSIGKHGH
jgi:hypothetical protein